MPRNILILGGTTEASALAAALAGRGDRATLSYAGRVASPRVQPVPTRSGGFGGIPGLSGYLRREGITHLVDATHPFAAQMSANAAAAAAATGTAFIALVRPPWRPGPGDEWTRAADVAAAAAMLAGPPRHVFLALGRLHVAAFAAQPQHHYLLRLVDAPDAPLPLPRATVVLARGPFDAARDEALMRHHRIALIVAKNSGGTGAEAKLVAARTLGLPAILIDRPLPPVRPERTAVAEILHWLDQGATNGPAERGV